MAHSNISEEDYKYHKALTDKNIVGYIEYKEFYPKGKYIDEIEGYIKSLKMRFMITTIIATAIFFILLFV